MRHTQRFRESGFTVAELAMVMVIIAMIVGVFSQMLISANQSASISKARVDVNRSLHNSMDAIETDVRQTSRFKVSGYDGYDTFAKDRSFSGASQVWTYNRNTLILLQYATTMGRGSDTREIVYLRTPRFDCAANKTQQPKYKKIVIYFLKDGQLHRRTVYNDLIDTYGNPYTGAPANYFCMNSTDANKFKSRAMKVHQDSILATGVSEFKVDYYEGDILVADQYSAPATSLRVLDAANGIKVTLKIQSPSGQVSDSQTLMIRKINNL